MASSAEELIPQARRNKAEQLAHDSEVKKWLRESVVAAHHAFIKDVAQGKFADDTLAEVLAD